MGYGDAAGCCIFLTSFLGVLLFRRCLNEVLLILLGMVSFASGIYLMSFITTTYMFYFGERAGGKTNPHHTNTHTMTLISRAPLKEPAMVLLWFDP